MSGDRETAGELLHEHLPPDKRENALQAFGSVAVFIRECLQSGWSGEVTVSLDAGRLQRVDACLRHGDVEKRFPMNEFGQ